MNLGELVKKKGAEVITTKPGKTVDSALVTMNEKHIGALMVVDDSGAVEGILSERDLLGICHKCDGVKYVKEVMTPKDKLVSLSSKDSIQKSMEVITDNNVRHLPIIDEGKLNGIISIRDIIKELLEEVQQQNKYLNEYIMGQNI